MVIINPNIPTQPASYSRPAGPAPILPADRVIMAVVLGQKASHLYELASGNLRLMAESQTPLRQGEELQLKVTGHDAAKRPQLEILSRTGQNLAPLIKATLPQQQNLNQLTGALLAGFRQGSNPAVMTATEAFISSLPVRQQLIDPTALRQVLRDSGLFMESHLAAGDSVPGDLKTALLKLARQLENSAQQRHLGEQGAASKLATDYSPVSNAKNRSPSGYEGQNKTPAQAYNASSAAQLKPPELPGDLRPQGRVALNQFNLPQQPELLSRYLLDMVRGSLARQDAHQLLHLQSSNAQQQQYVMEIPVRDQDGVDVWQLHIERRETQDDDTPQTSAREQPSHQWAITLNFDFPGMGPVKSVVKHSDAGLSVNFIAERPETGAMIKATQNELRERLEQQGIAQPEIHSHVGNSAGPDSPLHEHHLLEDKA